VVNGGQVPLKAIISPSQKGLDVTLQPLLASIALSMGSSRPESQKNRMVSWFPDWVNSLATIRTSWSSWVADDERNPIRTEKSER
jgi:hypothetical protein